MLLQQCGQLSMVAGDPGFEASTAGSGFEEHGEGDGWTIEPEDLAHISPYLTEHINRFGEYSTHELGIQPDAYDPKLDVDFSPLREQGLTAAGLGQAA
ncbi:Tn3 family transposase [Streptomyces lunaelactis]|uniref:Tn3 family transposase n=1 Tax=Streptomyces lunaelactis TaxID=1535768 RepID=UPI001585C570|nr:Tn3 family transposase [Streptomyces lunaelactis]NUK27784.1 Tn3 family transposase [Streptomyces lunaelactis]